MANGIIRGLLQTAEPYVVIHTGEGLSFAHVIAGVVGLNDRLSGELRTPGRQQVYNESRGHPVELIIERCWPMPDLSCNEPG